MNKIAVALLVFAFALVSLLDHPDVYQQEPGWTAHSTK